MKEINEPTPDVNDAEQIVAAVHKAALEAHEAGLCILPPAENGTKRPLPNERGKWGRYKTKRPTNQEVTHWYPGRSGIGVIAGLVSDRREAWDFDDLDTYGAFVDRARHTGLGEVIERIERGYCDATPGNGRRWLVSYPAEVERVPGSREILASRPKRPEEQRHDKDKIKILIEMPAFTIVAPSNGRVHPTGKPYVRRSGSFSSIATYTAEEREALMELARSFDAMRRTDAVAASTKNESEGLRPGDDFNNRTTWDELLTPKAWAKLSTHGDTVFWRRPGKTTGVSATTNYAGNDKLHVFSHRQSSMRTNHTIDLPPTQSSNIAVILSPPLAN